MMFGQPFGNQSLVLNGQWNVVELHNPMDDFETLFER